MTILGVFLFASLVLTSCGGPEADAKKAAECMCDGLKLVEKMADAKSDADKLKDLEEESKKLEEKCEPLMDELDKKYVDEESDEAKEFAEAFEKELEDCGY